MLHRGQEKYTAKRWFYDILFSLQVIPFTLHTVIWFKVCIKLLISAALYHKIQSWLLGLLFTDMNLQCKIKLYDIQRVAFYVRNNLLCEFACMCVCLQWECMKVYWCLCEHMYASKSGWPVSMLNESSMVEFIFYSVFYL